MYFRDKKLIIFWFLIKKSCPIKGWQFEGDNFYHVDKQFQKNIETVLAWSMVQNGLLLIEYVFWRKKN